MEIKNIDEKLDAVIIEYKNCNITYKEYKEKVDAILYEKQLLNKKKIKV